jgi:permuted papain-like amidase YaeF/Yiix C92 family enzyme
MRQHLPIGCFVLLLLVKLICAEPARKPLSAENWSKQLRDGDIVFIRSRSSNSQLIADLSSPSAPIDADNVFTHCGIVFKQGGTPKVYEGAGRGKVLSLALWQVSESNGGMLHNVYVRRWSRGDELTPQKLRIILDTAAALHYKPYDFGFSWTDRFSYCSKLVWKAYAAAGLKLTPLRTLKNYLDQLRPTEAQQALDELNNGRAFRDGRPIDPQEKAISPEDIYKSDKLISVTDESS